VVFLGSITTAEFAPKFRFERERFLCSLPNVNIKILPHRSKDPIQFFSLFSLAQNEPLTMLDIASFVFLP
jgi:hypothetical protein